MPSYLELQASLAIVNSLAERLNASPQAEATHAVPKDVSELSYTGLLLTTTTSSDSLNRGPRLLTALNFCRRVPRR